jgi:hypothetical protein
LRFNKSVATIVIGNPKIVDATPHSDKAIVITAKDVRGVTNVILLDDQGNEISDLQISVHGSSVRGKVQIHPRSSSGRPGTVHEYRAYACNPTCERIEDKLEADVRTREQSIESTTTTRESEGEASSRGETSSRTNTETTAPP